jgi:hypothetical protein
MQMHTIPGPSDYEKVFLINNTEAFTFWAYIQL